MAQDWTLPLIQHELDRLAVHGEFCLPEPDRLRLFGQTELALSRTANFARGHSCHVVYHAEGITFRKAPPHHSLGIDTDGEPNRPILGS